MHTRSIRQRLVGGLVALIVLSLVAVPATANHSWGNYHWARTSNPFTLQVGDNVTSAWDSYLVASINDWNQLRQNWNQSSVMTLSDPPVAGGTTPRKCRPVAGTIQVCNDTYGKNGWLGLAQIWISGGHITQGTAKMNDSYYNTATYNTPAERRLVMCQEIAHDFGLDHQDEGFGAPNLGSCMDYTSDANGDTDENPAVSPFYGPSNEWANQHDFEELVTIYGGHTDSTTTVAATIADAPAAGSEIENDPSDWGRVMAHDGKGRPSHFEKDLGGGKKALTFVIWADEGDAAPVDDGTGGGVDNGTGDGGQNDGGKKKDDRKQDGGKKDGGKHRHEKRHR